MSLVVLIGPAGRSDIPAIASLLEELDGFYGGTEFDPIEQRIANIEATVFGDDPSIRVDLAWDDGQVVGLASYSYLWPAAGVSRSLYLKELYVIHAHRGRGIGRMLMQRLREVAAANGCSRVEWTADLDNPHAQAFYDRLGVAPHVGKVFYRMNVT